MKKLLATILIFGAMLVMQEARAGTITITVATASGACSPQCTKTYTDTDANLAKIITAYQTQCNAKISGACSTLQVIQFWADQLIAGTVAAVTGNDTANLANAAISGYVKMNPQ